MEKNIGEKKTFEFSWKLERKCGFLEIKRYSDLQIALQRIEKLEIVNKRLEDEIFEIKKAKAFKNPLN